MLLRLRAGSARSPAGSRETCSPSRAERRERGLYWEVVLKSMKGILSLGDPRRWWNDALDQLAAIPLVLRPDPIAAICSLPGIHKDPFDRALIAQAVVEGLALVSLDAVMPRYASPRLRVVS
jgi:PIN domain nuclease of toxin-antitoxin system